MQNHRFHCVKVWAVKYKILSLPQNNYKVSLRYDLNLVEIILIKSYTNLRYLNKAFLHVFLKMPKKTGVIIK